MTHGDVRREPTFHDLDLATHPEVKDALTEATFGCATS